MNYTNISFPGLGLSLNPDRYFTLGSFTIYYYGIIIAVGLLLAMVYGIRRSKQFGITSDDLLDGALCIIPFAIICARLYYCIFSWADYAENPIEILYLWNGGLAIYGGVIGAVIGIIIFSKIKKVRLGAVLDLVALGFLIGQCIGRWGNFFNREAFGATTDFFLRMGLKDPSTNLITYYHPTFLYESFWNLIGFVILHFLSRRRHYDGQIALGYAAWYGFGRTLIETLRMDSLYWGPFRVSQLLAAVSCVAAIVILVWQFCVPHDPKKLFVNQVAAKAAAAEAEAAVAAETAEPESEDAVAVETEAEEDVAVEEDAAAEEEVPEAE